MALYPFTFRPILKGRIWGGRKLEELYKKELPPGLPVGESWEVSDRPGDVSVILNGPLAGKDLRWLMTYHAANLLGTAAPQGDRFPLLIKILDAREKLSLQVHPPPHKARELGGEPKTEMWYVAHADPGAVLYAGLKRGITRQQFEQKIIEGNVADCFQQLRVAEGDSMFLPSGRVHALGAGLVIFEVQQNSDTTYRVFDWDRVDLDGKRRELHVPQSLASIDFQDFEPELAHTGFHKADSTNARVLVEHSLFSVRIYQAITGVDHSLRPRRMQILGLVTGTVLVSWPDGECELNPGQFCLVPACAEGVTLQAKSTATFLAVEPGQG